MRVCVGSMLRDAEPYLDTFLRQCDELERLFEAWGDECRFVFALNDCVDRTPQIVQEWAQGRHVTIEYRNDGCPYYPSVDRPERWRHLAWVQNAVLDRIDYVDDDVFVWVESDLLINPSDVGALVEQLSARRPVLAPLLMGLNGQFYDTHGTSVGGVKFRKKAPFHECLEGDPEYVEADSSGGCFVALASVASEARCTPEEGYVGYCKTLVGKGYPWTLACRYKVVHP